MAAEMWYYTCEGKQMDPVTIKELRRLVGDGTLKPTDMVWKDGMPRWIRASSLKELFPDPTAALDQYFTTTKETDRKPPQVTGVTAPAGKSGADAAEPALTQKGSPPQADDEPQKKKRKPADSGADEEPSRAPRRRPEAKGGGANIFIYLAMAFAGLILLGGLFGGVIILIIMVKPGDDQKKPLAEEKKEKPAPPVNGVDPAPKTDPLPKDVFEGKGVKDTQLMKPNAEWFIRLRVRALHEARVSARPFAAGANTNFNIYVSKDNDPKAIIVSDVKPDANASVNFTVPNTEIVRVRIHNAGKTVNRCSIIYDVSP